MRSQLRLGVAALLCPVLALASGAAETPGVVCHVKVLSDKVLDVSSVEAWKKSFINDKMSDTEKAIAVWKSVVTFAFDGAPPAEFLQDENSVRDPIKCFNVYGYALCSDLAGQEEALGRCLGFKARGWALQGHSVPELFYEGSWHMLDPAYIDYWPKADGKLAGLEEMAKELAAFFQANPAVRGDQKLREFSANNGWKKGPESMSRCPTLDANGICPEGYHGWWSLTQNFNSKKNVYEYGAALGYELNIQLRPGERLVRNWSHTGLNVNMDGNGPKPNLDPPGKGALAYSPSYGDLAPGRIGNGRLEYTVPLAQVQASALSCENLASRGPALVVADAEKPGVLVLRMPSSYVYLSGEVALKSVLAGGGEIAVELSDNNGLDWKEATPKITAAGEQKIDLKKIVFRRYDYRLRFTLKGAGAGLEALKITHDIQHSQRALPALDAGENKIAFSVGPQEGTITCEGSMHPENKDKQVVLEDLHPVLNGLTPQSLRTPTGKGDATFNLATPGEMTRLRFGMNWRARGAGDSYDLHVSFDNGQTFKSVRKLEGPTVGESAYFAYSDLPPGTKAAQVRLAAKQVNTVMMFGMRIDADYKMPNSGFRPVKITYNWEENGQAKQDIHVAKQPEETYTIKCAGKPALKSLVLQLAE